MSKNTLLVSLLVGVLVIISSLGFVGTANACTLTPTECNRASDGVTFNGDRQLVQPIDVTVCHTYWNRLNVGTYRGRTTKWWAPIMKYNSWYGDLPVVTNECKKYSVKPGTELRLFADCVNRVITTGAMNKPGVYYMD